MSYFCADANGYLDDLASNGGLAAFVLWAQLKGGPIHDFVDAGLTYKPKELAEALASVTAENASVESTRQGLLDCARKADGLLIVTDGTNDEDDDEASLSNEKYSDSESRDDTGRWSAGGSISPSVGTVASSLREQATSSGNEHQQLVLENGSAHGDVGVGDKKRVAITPAQADILHDDSRAVSVVHTHPTNVPISQGDVGDLQLWPGAQSIVAITPDGSLYSVERGPEFANLQGYFDAHPGALEEWAYVAFKESTTELNPHTWSEANQTKVQHCALMAMSQVGLIQYKYALQGKSSEQVADANDRLNNKAKTVAKILRDRIKEDTKPKKAHGHGPAMPPTYFPGPISGTIRKDDLSVANDGMLFKGLVKEAVDHHEPELKSALLKAWKAAAGGVSMTELQIGVRRKDWDKILTALEKGKLETRTREVMEPRAASAYLRGVALAARPLRRLGIQVRTDDIEKASSHFNVARMNPHAAAWAKSRAAALVDEPEDVKRLIRSFVTQAVEDGFDVDETADLINDIIGLDARRGLALETYAAELQRDGYRDDEFESRFNDYVDELLLSRAETIARTEILMATNAGQQGLWEQALGQGLLDKSLKKIWIITDDETLCDECNAIGDDDPVDIDESFDSDDGPVDFPPLHPNCRCTIGLVEDEEKALAKARWHEHRSLMERQIDSQDRQTEVLREVAQGFANQKAPHVDVHVQAPEAPKVEVTVEAPVVNITPPTIHVAAPEVHVEAPKIEIQAPPPAEVKVDVHIPQAPKKEMIVERDPKTGRVKGIKER